MAKRRPDKILGAARHRPPSDALARAVNDAIDAVYGSDYSFEARSGRAPKPIPGSKATKSRRHVISVYGDRAASDWKIYDPQGKQLAGKKLEPFARHWVANYGSIGVNAKPGDRGQNFTHLDLIRGPAGTRLWNYGSIGFAEAPVEKLAGTGNLYALWDDVGKAMASVGGPVATTALGLAPTQTEPREPGTLANLFGREDFAPEPEDTLSKKDMERVLAFERVNAPLDAPRSVASPVPNALTKPIASGKMQTLPQGKSIADLIARAVPFSPAKVVPFSPAAATCASPCRRPPE